MSLAHDALGLPLDLMVEDPVVGDTVADRGLLDEGSLTLAAPPRPPAAPAPTGTEMDAEIAANWGLWSREIGRALLPTLERIADDTPGLASVLIGTADGFNLVALGLQAGDVARVSAISSSLLSLGEAVTEVVDQDLGQVPSLDLLTLRHGARVTVVRAVPRLIVGQLLLWLTGENTPAAELEERAIEVAARVHELLHVD